MVCVGVVCGVRWGIVPAASSVMLAKSESEPTALFDVIDRVVSVWGESGYQGSTVDRMGVVAHRFAVRVFARGVLGKIPRSAGEGTLGV